MNNLIEINFDNYILYSEYEKLSGYMMCKLCELNTFKKMYIVKDYINEDDMEKFDELGGRLLMCRSDAPFGHRSKLLRGRDLYINQLNSYLKELRNCCGRSIIIFSPYDEIGIEQNRFKGTEAITVLIEWQKSIVIEYVNNGFDAGEMTRGKGIHSHLFCEWSEINKLKDYDYVIQQVKNIGIEEYKKQRDVRVMELGKNSNYSKGEINRMIPMSPKPLAKEIVKKLYQQVLRNLFKYEYMFKNNITVISNIYNDKIYACEIMHR